MLRTSAFRTKEGAPLVTFTVDEQLFGHKPQEQHAPEPDTHKGCPYATGRAPAAENCVREDA